MSGDYALRIQGLRRSFGSVEAVAGLSLEVRRGEIYGFLGRNGAGKTTTIRMLMGLLSPDSGSIEILGEVHARPPDRVKAHLGYVSQEPHFYPWMTGDALGRFVAGFYPSWDHAEFLRLLKVLSVPANRKTSELSGGMRTKLSLALALAHRPEVLILDEPTGGLDPVARREFLTMIRAQARQHGRTTFFSSHLINEVELIADKIGIIQDGALIYQGDIPTLVDSVRRVEWHAPPEAAARATAAPADGGAGSDGKASQDDAALDATGPDDAALDDAALDATGPDDAALDDAALDATSPDDAALDDAALDATSPDDAGQDDATPDDARPGPALEGPIPPVAASLAELVLRHPELRLLDRRAVDLGQIIRGPAGWWRSPTLPAALQAAPLELEDIFIALASEEIPDL